jgi:hypothetical protein
MTEALDDLCLDELEPIATPKVPAKAARAYWALKKLLTDGVWKDRLHLVLQSDLVKQDDVLTPVLVVDNDKQCVGFRDSGCSAVGDIMTYDASVTRYRIRFHKKGFFAPESMLVGIGLLGYLNMIMDNSHALLPDTMRYKYDKKSCSIYFCLYEDGSICPVAVFNKKEA